MRKLGLSLLVFLGALTLMSFILLQEPELRDYENPTQPASSAVLGLPSRATEMMIDSYDYQGTNLKVVILPVIDETEIALYSNLEDSKTSVELKSENSCKALVNGGFYTLENTLPGLFISESSTLSEYQRNQTYDGVFTINTMSVPRITRAIPVDPLTTALQTGPILIENGKPQLLQIRNDKLARRMSLAVTGDNQMVFIALYNAQSAFLGPLLTDTPEILQAVSESLEIGIADAINLDGGSASAMYTSDFSLPEASLIGSYFCIN